LKDRKIPSFPAFSGKSDNVAVVGAGANARDQRAIVRSQRSRRIPIFSIGIKPTLKNCDPKYPGIQKIQKSQFLQPALYWRSQRRTKRGFQLPYCL